MATISRENIDTLHDHINVVISKEDYLPSFEKSLKQYAKKAQIPGFRKGNVPAGMVKKMYGQSLLSDEIFKTATHQLENYLKAEKLEIFAQPLLDASNSQINVNLDQQEEVKFSFEIGLKPKFDVIALQQNKTLNSYHIKVLDKMIDDEVERISRRFGKAEDQETVTVKDNIIYCTYEFSDENGQILEGAVKTEDTVLLDKMPKALSEKIMGKKAGETFVFVPSEICTPEELPKFLKDPLKTGEENAHQSLLFTLTKVALLIPRVVDSSLYAEVFPNETINDEAEFRALLTKELDKEFVRISKERLQSEIYEDLVHETPIMLPVGFLKKWLKEGQEKRRTDEEVENEFPNFEHQLRWTIISDKIIIENGINVDKEEVLEDMKGKILSYFGGAASTEEMPWLESYLQKMTQDEKTMNETYQRLIYEKLFNFLMTKYNVIEQEIDEEAFFKLPHAHDAYHQHSH